MYRRLNVTYGGTVYALTISSTQSLGAFYFNVLGLSPTTTYHYRAYAVNSNGTSYGMDRNFTTQESINISIKPDSSWSIGTLWMNQSARNNFTFYQNGTYSINATINITSINYSLVNYTNWIVNGKDRFYINYTIDNWVTEYPINITTTVIKTGVATSTNFTVGLRVVMPKTTTFLNRRGEFNITFGGT
jgi:hypothetical protein